MKTTRDNNFDPQLQQLIEAHCNGTITPNEFDVLQQRLSSDAAARKSYRQYLQLDAALANIHQHPGESEQVRNVVTFRAALFWRVVPVAAAALLLGVVLTIYTIFNASASRAPQLVGLLENVSGRVTIAGADGHVRAASNGIQLVAGDTLRTQESLSTATLVYPDGTRLALKGRTSITCNQWSGKHVTVHGGTLFSAVAPQPRQSTMRLATLNAALDVVGTRFALDATSDLTDVTVTEGRVRVRRLVDGALLDVPAGRRLVSSPNSEFVLQDIQPAPDEWSEDFEQGLPRQWASGRLVVADLPTGTLTGVRAMEDANKPGAPYEIATAEHWSHGLFAMHDDTHLEITFKMMRPGWFNILILTRTSAKDEPPVFAGNYIFDGSGWWPREPDRWTRVTIPLAEFRPLPPARGLKLQPIAFQVLLSSPEADRGLVVDQLRAVRGGPGVVEVTPVE